MYSRQGSRIKEKYLQFDSKKLYQIITYDRLPLCIENHYVGTGYKLHVGQYNQASNNSLFSFELIEHNYYKIRAFHSNLLLEVDGGSIDDNTYIIQGKEIEKDKTCQMFRFEKVMDEWYIIRARSSSKVIGFSDKQKETERKAQQFTEVERNINQLFQIREIE